MKYRVIPVTEFEQNCTILWCESTHLAAIIDPGGDIPKLLRVIAKEKLSVRSILLTHGHIDHVAAADKLSNRFNAPITGPHIADSYWLEMLPDEATLFDFPKLDALVPDTWLNEGDQIIIGKEKLNVLHCPGHTPGHVVFHHAASKTAFVGDVIFKNSVGTWEFEGGNQSQLMHSIFHKLFPLGDDVTFISGHGEKSTFGRERKYNPFLKNIVLEAQ